jgi:PRTRC genetic system protein A
MDARDAALQTTCPLVAMPRYGRLPNMPNGQRVIVAANGVFVQINLDWLDCVQRLMPQAPAMPLPYGQLQERIAFSFGVLPIRLIEAFVEQGRRALPNEAAGALVYSHRTCGLRLAMCEATRNSPVHIDYRLPALTDDETVAVDLHTHGRGPAFWSGEDDRDDQGIKVAGVFGCLHHERPQAEFRLVLNGMYRALPHPWQREEQGSEEAHGALETSLLRKILSLWLRARA